MDHERRRRVEEIYQQTLDLPADQRGAFLDRVCDETWLRREVDALLLHYEAAVAAFPADKESPAADIPANIGRFAVQELLGEGGMGTVYLARQQQPIARQVALKVIKPGMDTRQVLARFQAEQQALAILDHPGVARVYEAGTTEDGRPYFAMEYVAGLPITQYCDQHRLTPHARIDLFRDVCAAIQFAHQKGIIHRDIKPSNVLILESDGGPVAKVIDFGVAKAIQADLLPVETFTQQGQLVGTLEYMSPEQAQMRDVDTRTDVYTLGLLLYELLVGRAPFTSAQLREHGFEAMLRLIREEDPLRPSTRVSSLGDAATGSALARRTRPRSLSRYLRGDLDWIVMKALEKDRTRRYESVSSLSADLRRHLEDEPVEARPPQLGYRLRKFARRNRMGVGVGAVAVVALLAITAVSFVQSRRVAAEYARAQREAEVSREVAQYLGDMFHDASSTGGGEGARLLDTIEGGVTNLESDEKTMSGEARVRVLRILGSAYLNLGQHSRAQAILEKATALASFIHGADSLEEAESRFLLCSALEARSRFAEALAGLEQIEPVFCRELGLQHPRTRRCRWSLARLYKRFDRNDDALAIYDQLLADDDTSGGLSVGQLALYYTDMGVAYGNKFEYARGIDLCRKAVDLLVAENGADHTYCLLPLVPLTEMLLYADRPDEARKAAAQLRRVIELNFGPDHSQMAAALCVEGRIELEAGNLEKARELYATVLILHEGGEPNSHTIDALVNLAVVERRLECLDEAREHLDRGLALLRARFGDSDLRILRALLDYSVLERDAGNVAVADSLLEHVLDLGERNLQPNDPVLMAARLEKGRLLTTRGDFATAADLLRASYEQAVIVYGVASPRLGKVRSAVEALYRERGRPVPAWADAEKGDER